jgi:hypothetical protein
MSGACYDPMLVGSMEYILSVDIVTKQSWHVNAHGDLILTFFTSAKWRASRYI